MIIILIILLLIVNVNNIMLYPLLLIDKHIYNTNSNYMLSNHLCLSGITKYLMNIYVKNEEVIKDNEPIVVIGNHIKSNDMILNVNLLLDTMVHKKLKCIIHWVGLLIVGNMVYFSDSPVVYNKNDCNNYELDNNDIIMLYPEGNLYTNETQKKSDEWCDKNGYDKMINCRYPRLGAINNIIENNKINSIYSLCINYNNTIPSTMKNKNGYTAFIPDDVYLDFDIINIENKDIKKEIVDIFYDFDKKLGKKIDNTEYRLMRPSKKEKISICIQFLLLVIFIYLIWTNRYVYNYYLYSISAYYIVIVLVILNKFLLRSY